MPVARRYHFQWARFQTDIAVLEPFDTPEEPAPPGTVSGAVIINAGNIECC
ncbi:hypothetical protein D3C77_727880 [compost metagenome]